MYSKIVFLILVYYMCIFLLSSIWCINIILYYIDEYMFVFFIITLIIMIALPLNCISTHYLLKVLTFDDVSRTRVMKCFFA